MRQIGIEREYFCVDDEGNVQVVPVGLPHDDCGWLFESRSNPSTDAVEILFSLKADDYRLDKEIKSHNKRIERLKEERPEEDYGSALHRVTVPVLKVPKDIRNQARRHYAKGLIEFRNAYGYESHRNRISEACAGIHISITNKKTIWKKEDKVEVDVPFDFLKIIRYLDNMFAEEIKQSKRRPGFYQFKEGGRFEYRSLPNDVDEDKLLDALQKLMYMH